MTIKLPQAESVTSISLNVALNQRETIREYLETPITLTKLSTLLFSAQGTRNKAGKRTAPSAQEQYPISTYVVAKNISQLSTGLYQYNSVDHSLTEIKTGYFSEQLADAAIGEQPWISKAAAVVILAGNIESLNKHFSEQAPVNKRGERYNYIEVGAIAQNIQLQGVAIDIGMVLVGGFDNKKVKEILHLPQELEPSALVCMGNIK